MSGKEEEEKAKLKLPSLQLGPISKKYDNLLANKFALDEKVVQQ